MVRKPNGYKVELGRFGAAVGSVWVPGLIWNDLGGVGSIWCQSGAELGSVLVDPGGVISVQGLGRCGVDVGWTRRRCWSILGPTWGRCASKAGLDLGSIRCRSGPNSGSIRGPILGRASVDSGAARPAGHWKHAAPFQSRTQRVLSTCCFLPRVPLGSAQSETSGVGRRHR